MDNRPVEQMNFQPNEYVEVEGQKTGIQVIVCQKNKWNRKNIREITEESFLQHGTHQRDHHAL